MPRNVTKRDGAIVDRKGSRLADGTPTDKAPLQGGTSGEPPDPNPKSVVIHGLNDVVPAREVALDPERVVPKARRYQVVGGPDSVMYDGQRVSMKLGKVYTEGSVDFDLLRRQGVQLKELDDEVAA